MTEQAKPNYTALDLPPAPVLSAVEGPADRPYVLINMVMSVDGKTTIEGTERGLGSDTDQRLMRELRVNADIVLNGAGTMRASGTSSRIGDAALEEMRLARGKPRHPTAAVISASGDLPLDRAFFTARDFDAVVYVSQRAPQERRAALRATGRPVIELPVGDEIAAMLRHMRRELGASALLVEGGPTLNGELFEMGAVDEYFLTLGPVIVGGHGLLSAVEGTRTPARDNVTRLDLVSAVANPATGEVYLRYQVVR